MQTLAITDVLEERLFRKQPDPGFAILQELCAATGFHRDTKEGKYMENCLDDFYSNAYFTVEGLRQAFISPMSRVIFPHPLREGFKNDVGYR